MEIDPYITEEFTLTLRYSIKIDTGTGEIVEHKLISRSVDKSNFELVEAKPRKKASKKKEESNKPELILEANKITLNTAALELINADAGEKIGISYMKINKNLIPVLEIGAKDGCKLTKSGTVSCRGSKNTELSKYGDTFEVVQYENKEGIFFLYGNAEQTVLEGDNNINVEEVDDSLPLDVDLSELIEDKETDIEEIDSTFFKFD